jgi:formiminotetrahydrofolate cyclodeaminase
MLLEKSVKEALAAFSSSDPTPGGGSASALTSAVGASLLLMVTALPKTRDNSDADRSALRAAAAVLSGLRQQLAEAIDADANAYNQVVAAYKMPKGSHDEQQARKAAIQRALRTATDVPLGIMRVSAQALEQGVVVARHGQTSAASDVGVGAALLRAGAGGAFLNVEINLESIGDESYRNGTGAEAGRLTEAVERARIAIQAALGRR